LQENLGIIGSNRTLRRIFGLRAAIFDRFAHLPGHEPAIFYGIAAQNPGSLAHEIGASRKVGFTPIEKARAPDR
jgi:hypothetical protein